MLSIKRNSIERQRELESALALRQREVGELLQRKAQLEEELSMSLGVPDADDLSAAFPVLDYCGVRPKKDARQLHVEQIGSVMAQFDIAGKALTQRNRALRREVNELNRRIEVEGKRYRQAKQDTKQLADTTGALVNCPAGRVDGRNSLQSENPTDATLEKLEAQKALVAKEIRLGRLILKKKENAILSMVSALRERAALFDNIDELNNEIRVVDRDIKCEEETLRELNADYDAVIAKLNKFGANNECASRLLASSGIAEIKGEIGERVNVLRRAQEKIIKAQDRRIELLERRLGCIDKALQNNHLARDVNAYLTTKWSNSKELLPLESTEEQYNLDAIEPADEKCPSAICDLLSLEEKKLCGRMRILNCVKEEKERVIDALTCKVRALCREWQETIQELDQIASEAAYEEERQRIETMQYIQEQRIQYSNLFLEKQRLKSKAFAAARKGSRSK